MINNDLEFALEILDPQDAARLRKLFEESNEEVQKDILCFFDNNEMQDYIYKKRQEQLGL